MVLNSHRLFFFNCWNHTVFVSTRYHVWLLSGGSSLTVPFTVPSHQLQHAGVCAVAFYRVTENGETHTPYHSPLSPTMKLGACLAFRRWIGCKESWNSCWAYSSPEKALPVQERRPDFEFPEAIQSQVGEHRFIFQCFWDATEVSTFDGGRAIFGHSWVKESGTHMCVCNCVHIHTHTNK